MKLLAWLALLSGLFVFMPVSFAADEEPEELYQMKRMDAPVFQQRFQLTDAITQGETLEGLLCTVFYSTHLTQGKPLYGTLGINGLFYRVYFPAENLVDLMENPVDEKPLYAVVEATVKDQDGRVLHIEVTAVKTIAVDFEKFMESCAEDFTKRFDIELLERYPDAAGPLVSKVENRRQEEADPKQAQQPGVNPTKLWMLAGVALDWNAKTKTIGLYFNEQFVYLERVPYAQFG